MAILGSCYVKIPAPVILASLASFVVKLDLSDLTSSFWDHVDGDGAFIRVRDAAGADIPFDTVIINISNQTGTLFFKTDLTAGQLTEVRVVVDDAATEPAPGDANGRNAVWSDYDMMVDFNQLINRVNGNAVTFVGNASTNPYTVSAVSPSVNVHQGLAYDGSYFYCVDNNQIKKYDLTWTLVATNSDPIGDSGIGGGVNHYGDPTIYAGELYMVLEKYTNSPYNNQHIVVFNPATLAFVRSYDISAQLHEVSSICHNPADNRLYITDFTAAGDSKIHRYELDGTYAGFITLSAPIPRKQGIACYNGFFWITTDGKALYKVALDGSTIALQWQGDISGLMEGIASKGDGTFYILFDGSPSAIYTFIPSASAGLPGWLNLTGSGNAKHTGLPKRTTWTMGASMIPSNVSVNGAMLSYMPDEDGTANRATLALRGTSEYGIWNTSDSWLMASNYLGRIGERARAHYTHNGVTNRKIYLNGRLRGTDNVVVQKPGGAGDTMFIGAEDSVPAERVRGSLNWAYLRNGELSADWLRMEQRSWEQQTLYGVGDLPQAGTPRSSLSINLGTNVTGDAGDTGWTMAGMNTYTTSTRSTLLNPWSGARFFRANSSATATAYQDIDLSAYASRIDNGDATLELDAAIATDYNTSDYDGGGFYYTFYDALGAVIRQVSSVPVAPGGSTAGVWQEHDFASAIPNGTRSVRLGMSALRGPAGNDLNFAWDIASFKLTAPEVEGGVVPGPGPRRRQVVVC